MEWGFLTEPEQSHLARQSGQSRRELQAADQVEAPEKLVESGEEPS
jgi:hypothetical protein